MKLNQIRLIACKDLQDLSRDPRTVGLFAAFVVLGPCILVLAPFLFSSPSSANLARTFLTETNLCLFLQFAVTAVALPLSIIVGIDITAGEKERKCIETTLSIAVPRGTLVLGKMLAVLAASFTGCMILAAVVVSLSMFFGGPLGPALNKAVSVRLVGFLVIHSANILAFLSASMICIGLHCRSVKEAHMAASMLVLYLWVSLRFQADPMFIVPGIEKWLSFVPVLNLSVWRNMIISGSNDWGWPIIIQVVNGICIALLFVASKRCLEDEQIYSRS